MLRWALAATLASVCLPAQAAAPAAGEPSTAPILRIEPGMHTAMINRLALVDPGTLLTVSDDKTARLWRLADGKPLGVLRPPIGTEDEGALYAAAANGKMIAVGGRTCRSWDPAGFCVYLFAPDGSRMLGRIGQLPAPVIALSLSADGRYLAVGMQDRGGLRVLDMKAQGIAFDDTSFADTVTWLHHGPDGALAVASLDGTVRVYPPQGGAPKVAQVAGAWSVAFSPSGTELAVGTSSGGVTVLNAADLKVARQLTGGAGKGGGLSVVAWGVDGRSLMAAGGYGDGKAWYVRRWQGANLAQADDIRAADRTITGLTPLANGQVAVSTSAPSWMVLDASGRASVKRDPEMPRFPNSGRDWLKVSKDGSVVDFPLDGDGRQVVRFDLNHRKLTAAEGASPAAAKPAVDAAAQVADFENSARPTVGGVPVKLDPHEMAQAADAEGTTAVLGTDFYLRAYQSRRQVWAKVVPAAVRAVALTPDRSKVVAALADGTLRWYRRDSGAEVLALFAHPADRRWVAWTPEGTFDHSPGDVNGKRPDELIGFHLNRARNREAEMVRVEQLYGKLARRDLVMATFTGRTVEAPAPKVESVLTAGLPPKVEEVEVCEGDGKCRPLSRGTESAMTVSQPSALVTVKLLDRGAGIGKARVTRNGVAVDTSTAVVSQDGSARTEKHTLALEPGENRFVVSAFDKQGNVEAKAEDRSTVVVVYNPPAAKAQGGPRPTLYVFAVGIGAYTGLNPLDNAANDARAVVDSVTTGKLESYDKVVAFRLLDAQATKAEIVKKLGELAAQAKPEDAFILFLAGHGMAIDGRYYFAPVDVGKGGRVTKASFVNEGLSQDALSEALSKVKAGRGMLLLDTCFSGQLQIRDMNATTSSQFSNAMGRPILAAANAEALDAATTKPTGVTGEHGAFTTFLLSGLGGGADTNNNGRVDIVELANYVMDKVAEDAAKQDDFVQEPTFTAIGLRKFDVTANAKSRK